jgi:hypothetical protein
MIKIATLLALVACLTIIGCQPPEGMAGPTKEEFDALKMQVETLQTDVAAMNTAMDSLTVLYNAHITKYHKGSATATPPPATTKPPKVKVK